MALTTRLMLLVVTISISMNTTALPTVATPAVYPALAELPPLALPVPNPLFNRRAIPVCVLVERRGEAGR